MKRLLFLTLALLALTGCARGNAAVLQDALGLSLKDSRAIAENFSWPGHHDITIASVEPAQGPILDLLAEDAGVAAYEVLAEDGSQYYLLLRDSDLSFEAILDAEYAVVAGLIDNVMFPSFFTDTQG